MKLDKKRLRLYAVTDRAWAADTDALLRQVADAIDGGAGIVQLREKHLDKKAFLEEARHFVALCREKGALSIINDDVDIALASGADGVHVGQEDLEAGTAREKLGPDKILGVSAHNVAEALRAEAAGADYLGVGAMFPTGTKSNVVPTAPETLKAICQAVSIPVVAIGGVNAENLPTLAGTGIAGAAVVSAIFSQSDLTAAARALRAAADLAAR